MPVSNALDGDNLLYRLFLELLKRDDEVADTLVQKIISSVAIWFPPTLYERFPVLLPWVVRDPKCRPHIVAGHKTTDEWGSPTPDGYLRDDNSLIKSIPRSLFIQGPKDSFVKGSRLGSGFVASHVWREVKLERLASRDPRLNSFVPNLVWLPRQIAKLSDREGSRIQLALKSTSWAIYRHRKVSAAVQPHVEAIWRLLPQPLAAQRTDVEDLNYFVTHDSFLASRATGATQVIQLLDAVVSNAKPGRKGRIPTRYFQNVHLINAEALRALRTQIATLMAHQEYPRG
jgi:hypothetical protein